MLLVVFKAREATRMIRRIGKLWMRDNLFHVEMALELVLKMGRMWLNKGKD